MGAPQARRSGLAALVAVLLCSACGSTVPIGGAGALTSEPQGSADSLSAGREPASHALSGSAPGSTVAPGASRGGTPVASGGLPSPVTHTDARLVTGVGIDAKHVYVGVPTEKDFDTWVNTVGIDGLSTGDQEGDVKAVVAYVNQHGGVLGRQLVPVFHDNSSASLLADRPATVQANCTYFANDRPVAAVVDMTGLSGLDSWGCWRAHRIPFFVATPYVDQVTLDQMSPYIYGMNANRIDSYLPTLLGRQQALGYFTPWDTLNGRPGSEPVKVGILYEENGPQDRRVVAQLKRELQARHIPVVAEFGTNGTDVSQVSAQVLRFKAAGVTHAYIYYELENLLFMRQAENQSYRPRYSAWMGMGPALMQQEAPARQLRGALGAAWNPDLSVTPENNPGDVSGAAPLCRRILREGGLTYPRYSLAEMVGFTFCDALRLAAEGINAAGGSDPAQLRQAVAAAVAAKRYASAIAFRAVFSLTRSDENGAVRDLGYVEACSCFRYLSKVDHDS
jgi:ABC-type branched-subunit amino acid transport system substrate-binding protein